MSKLEYISDELLTKYTNQVIECASSAYKNADEHVESNVIDPFSAMFDAAWQGITIADWFEKEKNRQVQKTLQNAIGDFHQNILGSVPGWRNPGRGGGYDIINSNDRILAEIKNKFNTMNSSAAAATYLKLSDYIDNQYKGYTAYVVFIVPQRPQDYEAPWSPNAVRYPLRNDILKIDGESFYEKVTNTKNALEKLYTVLPSVISQILDKTCFDDAQLILLNRLFNKAYK